MGLVPCRMPYGARSAYQEIEVDIARPLVPLHILLTILREVTAPGDCCSFGLLGMHTTLIIIKCTDSHSRHYGWQFRHHTYIILTKCGSRNLSKNQRSIVAFVRGSRFKHLPKVLDPVLPMSPTPPARRLAVREFPSPASYLAPPLMQEDNLLRRHDNLTCFKRSRIVGPPHVRPHRLAYIRSMLIMAFWGILA